MIAVLLLVSPAQKEEERWQRIHNWENSTVDISSSNVVFSDFIGRIRLRMNLTKPETGKGGEKYKTVIETIDMKCEKGEYRIVKIERFNGKGPAVETEEAKDPIPWMTVNREKNSPFYFEPACKLINETRRKL